MRALVAVIALAGCGFSNEGNGHPDTSGLCPFEFTPEYLDPCKVNVPQPLDELPDLNLVNDAAIDTYSGEINGMNLFGKPPMTVVDGVRVMWTHDFSIAPGVTLRTQGDKPLMIVASGKMRIDGTIDASSSAINKAPGSNPSQCTSLAAAAGATCSTEGASGGGGGGFGAPGGTGGRGGDGKNCGAGVTGRDGGAGGKATDRAALTFRAGCNGGDGAKSNESGSMIGAGGFGGGAVGLIARDLILVTGTIDAGGGGGQTGLDRAGGGGGGSGGMVFVESKEVNLDASSLLAANGGGGAGGCDHGTTQTAGQDGRPDLVAAKGGLHEGAGGDGGDGGVLGVENGKTGNIADRGAGGGGGGVGMIRVHALTGSRNGMTSPALLPD